MTELFLVAAIAGERVAIAATAIEAVVDLWHTVPVPLSADHVIGIAAVRSRIVTVIDAAAALGLRAKATGNRAIMITADDHRYALRVDAIAEVIAPEGPITAFEPSIGAHWQAVAIGVVAISRGFAVLIDPARLIAGPLAKAAFR